MLNISIRDKRISFEKFKKLVGHHFKAYPNLSIEEYYERLTGRSAKKPTKKNSKSN